MNYSHAYVPVCVYAARGGPRGEACDERGAGGSGCQRMDADV